MKDVLDSPLENIEASYPMELVHMDYLTIESNKSDKDVNILVVMDHFTRLAQAFATLHKQLQW